MVYPNWDIWNGKFKSQIGRLLGFILIWEICANQLEDILGLIMIFEV